MNDTQHYENIHFNRTINTINSVPVQFPLHWHKYVEIVALPVDAEVTKAPVLQIQQTEYRLQPGDILFIWPGELHQLSGNEEKGLIGLQFAATLINDLPEFAPFLSQFRSIRHIKQEEDPAFAESILFRMKHIFALQRETEFFSGVEAMICILEMFMDMGRYLEKTDALKITQTTPGAYKIEQKMNIACGYISENCERELNLDMVADYIGFSSCYFSRVFKQVTNYSFVEYLTIQRVKRAQALLADAKVPITEVSYQSGFKSISTFNRVFKEQKGCSPREYRKYYLVS